MFLLCWNRHKHERLLLQVHPKVGGVVSIDFSPSNRKWMLILLTEKNEVILCVSYPFSQLSNPWGKPEIACSGFSIPWEPGSSKLSKPQHPTTWMGSSNIHLKLLFLWIRKPTFMEWPLFIKFVIQIHQRFESCFSMRNPKRRILKKPKLKRRLVVIRPIFAVEFLRKPNDVSELSLSLTRRLGPPSPVLTLFTNSKLKEYLFQNLAGSKRAFIYSPQCIAKCV